MQDMTRPSLHLTARSGWVNDPYGLTWHDGTYHLFFQYVPGRTDWDVGCHWGHATSPDLLTWTERPPALAPGDGDDGCWSGSVVVAADGSAHAFYTSVAADRMAVGSARIARPLDAGWSEWVKGELVAELPAALDAVAFRDPYVFRDGDSWSLLMSGGLTDGTALALRWESFDLRTWSPRGTLASRHLSQTDPVWTGAAWECAQFFPVADRWVLLVSVWEDDRLHHEAYAVGGREDGEFVPERWGRLTYGPSLYAGSVGVDRDGEPVAFHWLRGVAGEGTGGQGWAGAHSLPHRLSLEGSTLVAAPHPAVTGRRGDPLAVTSTPVRVGLAVDVEWLLGDGDGNRVGELVLRGGGVEALRLSAGPGGLVVDVAGDRTSIPLSGSAVRVVVDGPVVEVFSTAGVFAAPIQATDDRELTLTGRATATVYELRAADSGAG